MFFYSFGCVIDSQFHVFKEFHLKYKKKIPILRNTGNMKEYGFCNKKGHSEDVCRAKAQISKRNNNNDQKKSLNKLEIHPIKIEKITILPKKTINVLLIRKRTATGTRTISLKRRTARVIPRILKPLRLKKNLEEKPIDHRVDVVNENSVEKKS